MPASGQTGGPEPTSFCSADDWPFQIVNCRSSAFTIRYAPVRKVRPKARIELAVWESSAYIPITRFELSEIYSWPVVALRSTKDRTSS